MSKFVEVYKLKSQEDYYATYEPTTGDALDYQPVTLEFSLAGCAIKAPDEIKITVEWDGDPELN